MPNHTSGKCRRNRAPALTRPEVTAFACVVESNALPAEDELGNQSSTRAARSISGCPGAEGRVLSTRLEFASEWTRLHSSASKIPISLLPSRITEDGDTGKKMPFERSEARKVPLTAFFPYAHRATFAIFEHEKIFASRSSSESLPFRLVCRPAKTKYAPIGRIFYF